jgi:4-amino-4-deoxy-L-arabinose transferase-like glycosyltransferase
LKRLASLDLALVAILLVAAAFRLYRIDIPFIEAHSWRQVTNADITRHFSEGVMNPFMPRVSWGGLNGAVGMEFPLLHYVTAIVWLIAGESDKVARLVAVAFSLMSIVLGYFLGARLFGRPAGRATAFLLAFSPSLVFFGRSFLSDTPMLTFSIGAVLAWDRYFDKPTTARAVVAALVTSLAPLVKLPAILVLGPIGGLALSRLGWAALRDPRLWAGCLAAIALVAGWYWHADRIYLETGLTQAIFRPSGTYPQEVAPGVIYGSVSHWSTAAQLRSGEFWIGMLDRFWGLHLTALGFLGALFGTMLVWRSGRRLVVGLWLLAGFLLLIVSTQGQWMHEFHQLPLMPPLALLFGAAAAPLFDAGFLKRFAPLPVAVAVISLALFTAAIEGFRSSNVRPSLYRHPHLSIHFLEHASFLQSFMPPDALVITVDYDTDGANSPMLLYYARRQGWSFDIASISPMVIENLRARHGARYFASSIGGRLVGQRPDVRFYLEGYERVSSPPGMGDLLVVDLSKPTR